MTTVDQLLPVFSPGDAIGNATLETQRMLRSLGFRSEIFAGLIDPALARRAHPAEDLDDRLESGDGLIYHLSIGSPLARRLERTRARRIIVYHNITPPGFYRRTSPRVVHWLERGLDDLRRLAPIADLAIGVSSFNLRALEEAGARHGVVIPPAVDLERLGRGAGAPGRHPTVLFVGRLAPNKRQDTLIRAVAALRGLGHAEARLILLGGSDDTSPYLGRLRRLADRLGIAEAVEMPARRVSDRELAAAYRAATAFACASEHEGFCVPLVEAMWFGLPIVARAAGAVPETLGEAGLLVDGDDPLVWGALLARVLEDSRLRAELAARGHARAAAHGPAETRARLAAALAGIGLRPHPSG